MTEIPLLQKASLRTIRFKLLGFSQGFEVEFISKLSPQGCVILEISGEWYERAKRARFNF